MAKLTRWALFWRAFFLVTILGTGANAADEAEVQAWEDAVVANSAEGYYLYLSLYPAGDFVDEALRALTELGLVDTRGLEAGAFPTPGGINNNNDGEGLYQ